MTEQSPASLPLVSCVVTCYQKIPYLYEAVDSVLTQNYPRLELIVADDGSDGFSIEAFRDYVAAKKGQNLENAVILHQPMNVGTVQNIRGALPYAVGEYCLNLDGDDVLDHNSVISEMIAWALPRHLELLECGKRRCDESLQAIEILPTPEERRQLKRLNSAKKQFHSFAVLRFLNIGGGSGMLYRRDCVEKNGLFDPRYRNWQDGPSLLAFVRQGKMIPVNHEIIAIKYRSGGVSNTPRQNSSAFRHISADRMQYLETVTLHDRWNPFFFRRRRFLFHYYWEKAKTKPQQFWTLFRFPEAGLRFLSKLRMQRKNTQSFPH